jgi:multidrug efflux system membrane fusion protein
VWVVNPDRTVAVPPVTVGTVEGEVTEITSGLKPGDQIVTVGVDKLQDGSKVNIEGSGKQGSGKKSSKEKS